MFSCVTARILDITCIVKILLIVCTGQTEGSANTAENLILDLQDVVATESSHSNIYKLMMRMAMKYRCHLATGVTILLVKHFISETTGLGRAFTEIIPVIGICLLIWLTIDRYVKLQQRRCIGLPGPPAALFLGNLHQIGKIMAENGQLLYNVFEQWKKKYGKLYGFYMGPRLFVIVEHRDMIRQILITKFDCFTDRMKMDFLTEALDDSIVNAQGLMWRHMRAHMSPVFTKAKLRQMSQIVHEKLDIFLENISEFSKTGETFDIYERYKALTLDVIARSAFAISSSCQNDINDTFLTNCVNYFNGLPSPQKSLLMNLSVLLPEAAPILSSLHAFLSKSGRAEAWLYQCISNVIDSRRKKTDMMMRCNDLVRMLVNGTEKSTKKREHMNYEQIRSSCLTFLLAGYETTSTALAFATWLLATHQDVQEKLYEEIQHSAQNTDEEDFYDSVIHLPYLDAVFRETLRLYPPITFFVNRSCTKRCRIGDVDFYPGTQVGIPIWNIHRDPEIWLEPEEFKPERFYKCNNHDPMSWLPFGAGPRNCIGMRFAIMEFKTTLAKLLLRFTISAAPEEELIVQNPTAMLQTPFIKVKVEQR